jgi:hypothetical protein
VLDGREPDAPEQPHDRLEVVRSAP